MKFIIGEDWISMLDRLTYRGIIGIAYESTLSAILAYIVFGVFCILAVIGFCTVIKWLFTGLPRKKEDPGKKWLRTGRM